MRDGCDPLFNVRGNDRSIIKAFVWNLKMSSITEKEFAGICQGIYEDRESICKHNPLGTQDEILLWMLLSCLISYLNLTEIETPCFTGKPTAETYRDAILFVLKDRKSDQFEAEYHLRDLTTKV